MSNQKIKLTRRKIIGLDKIPSTDRVKRFAYCILNEFGVKEDSGVIELTELPTILKKRDIQIIAIDNIFELYSTQEEIINFLRKNKVKLVQVTGSFSSQKKLSFLAKRYLGMSGGHLSPEMAAETAAKLAYIGVGQEVKIFENVTKIIISRSRVIGEGGQHQVKYARNIANLILQAKRDIEEKLKKHNLFFEVFTREGDFGLKSAKFLVYAPYDVVKKLVRDYKGDLYQIKISPISSEKIAFNNTHSKKGGKKYIICGLDPGDSTGLAILDLNGNVIMIKSRKEWSMLDILDDIFQYGQPLIIATDVPKIPQTVEKIAKKTGSIIFKPKRTLSIAEKHELVRQLGVNVKNAHERDALSAAYLAFKRYRNLLEKVDSVLNLIPISIDSQEVKKDVILGHSIKESIMNHLSVKLEEYIEKRFKRYVERVRSKIALMNDKNGEISILRKKISEFKRDLKEKEKKIDELLIEKRKLEKKIDELYTENLYLKEKIKKLEFSLNELEKKLNGKKIVTNEEELSKLKDLLKLKEKIIDELKRENEKLKLIISKSKLNIPIKVLKQLTIDEITYVDETFGISPGDIIYVVDPAGSGRKAALELIKKGIVGVIVGDYGLPKQVKDEFLKANIPVIPYNIISKEIEKSKLDDELMFISKKIFNLMAREYKNSDSTKLDREDDLSNLENIIEQYRRKRAKNFNSH